VDRSKGSRAIVHIGAPKAGSTYLQNLLWDNRSTLLDAGVQVLGAGPGDHSRASHDLRGREQRPDDPRTAASGAWQTLASLAGSSSAAAIVVSDEHLSAATAEQVTTAVDSLAPREVRTVFVARHPAGALASAWQEQIKLGAVIPFEPWARKRLRPTPAATRFWTMHDPADVQSRWGGTDDRLTIVTLPLPGAPHLELWQRFCEAGDMPPVDISSSATFVNESLGQAEAEFQRRVNELLPDDFGRWNHLRVSRNILGNQILANRRGSGRPVLSDELQAMADQRARVCIDALADSGARVVGDLGDLLVGPDRTVTEVDDATLLAVALDVAPALASRVSDKALAGRLSMAAEREDPDAIVQLTAAAVISIAGDLPSGTLASFGSSGGLANARTKATGLIDRSRTASRLADKMRARHRRAR
jgi:hypothetical protein